MAKAAGLKVIASAGSEEKVAYVKSLDADVVFNYKTTSTKTVLEEEGPIHMYVSSQYITLDWHLTVSHRYWDNVGGESLEAAIGAAAPHARVIVRILPLLLYTRLLIDLMDILDLR